MSFGFGERFLCRSPLVVAGISCRGSAVCASVDATIRGFIRVRRGVALAAGRPLRRRPSPRGQSGSRDAVGRVTIDAAAFEDPMLDVKIDIGICNPPPIKRRGAASVMPLPRLCRLERTGRHFPRRLVSRNRHRQVHNRSCAELLSADVDGRGPFEPFVALFVVQICGRRS